MKLHIFFRIKSDEQFKKSENQNQKHFLPVVITKFYEDCKPIPFLLDQ